MKIDYVEAFGGWDDSLTETAAIEKYWTLFWQKEESDEPKDASHTPLFRLIRPYLDKLPQGAKIFDAGCGDGRWLSALQDLGYDMVGMDISVDVISRIQSEKPSLSVMAGDIRHTGLPDREFDAYISWGVFEHTRQGMSEFVEEAHRILKPDGLLLFSVPGQNRLSILWPWQSRSSKHQACSDPKKLKRPIFFQYRFTPEEIRRTCEEKGFRWISGRVISTKKEAKHLLAMLGVREPGPGKKLWLYSKIVTLLDLLFFRYVATGMYLVVAKKYG